MSQRKNFDIFFKFFYFNQQFFCNEKVLVIITIVNGYIKQNLTLNIQ